jgi:hypothetical protein
MGLTHARHAHAQALTKIDTRRYGTDTRAPAPPGTMEPMFNPKGNPMGLFHRLARHHHRGHHHDHHHSHCHHDGDEASRIEHITERAAAKLDLNEAQQQKFAALLEAVQAQRAAVKSPDLIKEISGLVQGERFDRDAAKAWIDQRLQSLQNGAPGVLAALADFYDALDKDQQQALRFMLRVRGGLGGSWGRWGRRAAQ